MKRIIVFFVACFMSMTVLFSGLAESVVTAPYEVVVDGIKLLKFDSPISDPSSSKLYALDDAYVNLFLRDVDVSSSDIAEFDGQTIMVLNLFDGRTFGIDIVAKNDKMCVSDEALEQFCLYYFGEDYDYFANQPDF